MRTVGLIIIICETAEQNLFMNEFKIPLYPHKQGREKEIPERKRLRWVGWGCWWLGWGVEKKPLFQ